MESAAYKGMSDKELNEYLKSLRKKARNLTDETKKIKFETSVLMAENEKMKIELEVLKRENRKLLDKGGFEQVTDEEFNWYFKHKDDPSIFQNYYFKVTPEQIKRKFAEFHKKEKFTGDPKFNGIEEYSARNGWISPDGRYNPVNDFAQHENWAREYLGKNEETSKISEENNSASSYLESLGWVRVMNWVGAVPAFSYEYNKVTKEQKDIHKI